jgi:hypothetical protein
VEELFGGTPNKAKFKLQKDDGTTIEVKDGRFDLKF